MRAKSILTLAAKSLTWAVADMGSVWKRAFFGSARIAWLWALAMIIPALSIAAAPTTIKGATAATAKTITEMKPTMQALFGWRSHCNDLRAITVAPASEGLN